MELPSTYEEMGPHSEVVLRPEDRDSLAHSLADGVDSLADGLAGVASPNLNKSSGAALATQGQMSRRAQHPNAGTGAAETVAERDTGAGAQHPNAGIGTAETVAERHTGAGAEAGTGPGAADTGAGTRAQAIGRGTQADGTGTRTGAHVTGRGTQADGTGAGPGAQVTGRGTQADDTVAGTGAGRDSDRSQAAAQPRAADGAADRAADREEDRADGGASTPGARAGTPGAGTRGALLHQVKGKGRLRGSLSFSGQGTSGPIILKGGLESSSRVSHLPQLEPATVPVPGPEEGPGKLLRAATDPRARSGRPPLSPQDDAAPDELAPGQLASEPLPGQLAPKLAAAGRKPTKGMYRAGIAVYRALKSPSSKSEGGKGPFTLPPLMPTSEPTDSAGVTQQRQTGGVPGAPSSPNRGAPNGVTKRRPRLPLSLLLPPKDTAEADTTLLQHSPEGAVTCVPIANAQSPSPRAMPPVLAEPAVPAVPGVTAVPGGSSRPGMGSLRREDGKIKLRGRKEDRVRTPRHASGVPQPAARGARLQATTPPALAPPTAGVPPAVAPWSATAGIPPEVTPGAATTGVPRALPPWVVTAGVQGAATVGGPGCGAAGGVPGPFQLQASTSSGEAHCSSSPSPGDRALKGKAEASAGVPTVAVPGMHAVAEGPAAPKAVGPTSLGRAMSFGTGMGQRSLGQALRRSSLSTGELEDLVADTTSTNGTGNKTVNKSIIKGLRLRVGPPTLELPPKGGPTSARAPERVDSLWAGAPSPSASPSFAVFARAPNRQREGAILRGYTGPPAPPALRNSSSSERYTLGSPRGGSGTLGVPSEWRTGGVPPERRSLGSPGSLSPSPSTSPTELFLPGVPSPGSASRNRTTRILKAFRSFRGGRLPGGPQGHRGVKPMGIQCFQLATPVLRALDLLGQMEDERVRELKKCIKVSFQHIVLDLSLLFSFTQQVLAGERHATAACKGGSTE